MLNSQSSPLYIAVEGPIGVGKTTLVRRLAEKFRAKTVLEAFEENPFLSKFYEDRDRYAFSAQIFFLMSRFKQQQDLLQVDLFQPDILADYHLFKDRIFAELTLGQEELALYHKVYESLKTQILKPSVVIYLHAPLETLLARIRKRGREFERNMDPNYLESLSKAYQNFFLGFNECPVLSINNSQLDYACHSPESTQIIDAIAKKVTELAALPSPAKESFTMAYNTPVQAELL